MQSHFEENSTLAPFIVHCAGLVDDIDDGYVGSSNTFKESLYKYYIEGNDE
jgi:hypothetical protein